MKLATELAINARLIAVMNAPLDHDLRPISLVAVERFMQYCRQIDKDERPIITATPQGEIRATWYDYGFSCHFFRDGTTAGYRH